MPAERYSSQPASNWPRILLVAILGSGGAVLLGRLYAMWSVGGTPWQQADWLINMADGPVRRGVSGNFFLWLSDLTGIGVIALVCAVQAALVVAVFLGVFRALLRIGVSERMLLLALSPAFLSFWVFDPSAGFRKELLGVTAFLPLLACAHGSLKPLKALSASVAIFAVGVAFHEVNAFVSVYLLVAFVFCLDGRSARAGIVGWGLVLGVLSLAGLLFAMKFPTVTSSDTICAPVLARGGSPEVCNGIFYWIQFGVSDLRENARVFAVKGTGWVVLFSYVVISAPAVILTSCAPKKTYLRLAGLLSVLPMIPLYVMSVDWGRWMALHVTVVTLVSLVALLRYRPEWIHEPIRPFPLVFGLSICLFYGFGHVTPKPIPGVTMEIVKVVANPSILWEELREAP